MSDLSRYGGPQCGLITRTFGRWHALGPYLYFQPGQWWLLHFYARWFRLPHQHGWHWGLTAWLGRDHHFHWGGG